MRRSRRRPTLTAQRRAGSGQDHDQRRRQRPGARGSGPGGRVDRLAKLWACSVATLAPRARSSGRPDRPGDHRRDAGEAARVARQGSGRGRGRAHRGRRACARCRGWGERRSADDRRHGGWRAGSAGVRTGAGRLRGGVGAGAAAGAGAGQGRRRADGQRCARTRRDARRGLDVAAGASGERHRVAVAR